MNNFFINLFGKDITFANAGFVYLLLLLIPAIIWYVLKQKKQGVNLQISSLQAFKNAPKTYKHYLRHFLFVLRLMSFSLLVIVLMRPQSKDSWQDITTKGIDIVIALDISGSMLAEDLKPNRLEASKRVAMKFISGRSSDRIGLVVFSGESFTQCPLTIDHKVLINLFKDIKSGMIEDGTAIGLGLANAVNRLKDSDAISKIIILLTDGVNNSGEIAPIDAAKIAKIFGVRVYTIGIGTRGKAPYPVQTPFGKQYQYQEVDIDEETLKDISKRTNGEYFRATDNKSLKNIYTEIDKLERSKIEIKKQNKKNEEFLFFAIWAGILLIAEILLRNKF